VIKLRHDRANFLLIDESIRNRQPPALIITGKPARQVLGNFHRRGSEPRESRFVKGDAGISGAQVRRHLRRRHCPDTEPIGTDASFQTSIARSAHGGLRSTKRKWLSGFCFRRGHEEVRHFISEIPTAYRAAVDKHKTDLRRLESFAACLDRRPRKRNRSRSAATRDDLVDYRSTAQPFPVFDHRPDLLC